MAEIKNELGEAKNNYLEVAIVKAMSLPGVRVDRQKFLEKELNRYVMNDKQMMMAIEQSPLDAGISNKIINHIADSCIKYETNKVSAISFVAGIPGGIGMAATIPADVLQYIGHMLKLLQKLMFLYGWESLISDSKNMDDETKNMLIMMIGVMVGVDKAGIIVAKLALGMSKQIEKKIAQKALTKTVIYPIVKKISAIAGAKMTKEIYAKAVAKAVPVLGGAVSGTLTYVTFKPMGKKLKKYLISLNEDTAIPPEYKDVDIIDIEV